MGGPLGPRHLDAYSNALGNGLGLGGMGGMGGYQHLGGDMLNDHSLLNNMGLIGNGWASSLALVKALQAHQALQTVCGLVVQAALNGVHCIMAAACRQYHREL